MKTKLFVLFALSIALLAVQMEAEATPTCKICTSPDFLGTPCAPQSEVEISEHPFFGGGETTYWVVYDANETISYAKIVMKFSSDSGLEKTVDKFDYPSGGSGVLKAFSISGSNLIGPAVMKIKSEAGTCTYAFNVVDNP